MNPLNNQDGTNSAVPTPVSASAPSAAPASAQPPAAGLSRPTIRLADLIAGTPKPKPKPKPESEPGSTEAEYPHAIPGSAERLYAQRMAHFAAARKTSFGVMAFIALAYWAFVATLFRSYDMSPGWRAVVLICVFCLCLMAFLVVYLVIMKYTNRQSAREMDESDRERLETLDDQIRIAQDLLQKRVELWQPLETIRRPARLWADSEMGILVNLLRNGTPASTWPESDPRRILFEEVRADLVRAFRSAPLVFGRPPHIHEWSEREHRSPIS